MKISVKREWEGCVRQGDEERNGLANARPTVAMCVLFQVLLSTNTVRFAIADI